MSSRFIITASDHFKSAISNYGSPNPEANEAKEPEVKDKARFQKGDRVQGRYESQPAVIEQAIECADGWRYVTIYPCGKRYINTGESLSVIPPSPSTRATKAAEAIAKSSPLGLTSLSEIDMAAIIHFYYEGVEKVVEAARGEVYPCGCCRSAEMEK